MPSSRPLPWCTGPKLEPFRFRDDANQDVTILEQLGSGLHGEVFKATIQGKTYALKVFRFFHANELVAQDTVQHGRATIEDVINHNDPFNCECRAYGRLKEVGLEHLAVRCFGYLMLDQATEALLAAMGHENWKRGNAFKRPLRCIVKELLPSETQVPAVRYEILPQMRQDLQELHAYGIVVWDLHTGNYLDGRLIDFSQAKTVPHFELSWNSQDPYLRKGAIDCCARDYSGFDGVVEDWNESHPDQMFWKHFLPNMRFGRRLRDRSRYRKDLARQEGVRLDAIFYDWKNKQPWRAKVGVFPEIRNAKGHFDVTKSYMAITAIKKRVENVEKKSGNIKQRRPRDKKIKRASSTQHTE